MKYADNLDKEIVWEMLSTGSDRVFKIKNQDVNELKSHVHARKQVISEMANVKWSLGTELPPAPGQRECAPNRKEATEQTWESGRRYMTHAGFRVRSKAEKIIADYLIQGGIRFLYEPVLRVGGQTMRPDFYLSDYDLPYEHFGLNTADYLREVEAKIARYYRARMPFMYTTFLDEPDIEDVIVDKLAEATLDL